MKVRENYKYTKDHEWIDIANKDFAVIGITDYAQEQMGDIVYVELPDIEAEFEKGDSIAVVNSPKNASDVFTPVSVVVVGINEELDEHPDLVNSDPYNKGWLCKVKISDKNDLKTLMNSKEYVNYVEQQEQEED